MARVQLATLRLLVCAMAPVVILLSACGTQAEPPVTGSATPTIAVTTPGVLQPMWRPKQKAAQVVMSEQDKRAARTKQLDSMVADAKLPAMQYPELKRWIYIEETASVMVPCLQQKGFPVTANAAGTGYSGGIPNAQNQPFAKATIECTAMYTIDPRLSAVPDDEHKGIIYDYYTQFLIPCVRKLGFQMKDLPSRATWIANPQVLDDYPGGSDDVAVKCPINTPSKALLGEDY